MSAVSIVTGDAKETCRLVRRVCENEGDPVVLSVVEVERVRPDTVVCAVSEGCPPCSGVADRPVERPDGGLSRGGKTDGYAAASVRRRCFDVVVSSIFLFTLFPLCYLVIGIAIKATSRGPVLFRQKRSGIGGREFTCLKFRTMVVNDEADTVQAAGNDSRITSVGRFLRRTSLDELPQFINVLRGDMAIIGPRPHMLYHTEYYSERIPGYLDRLAVRPGITGLAQVLGYRGETPETADMARRVKLDLWYMRHRSFRLDAYIFLRTLADFIRMKK